MIGGLLGQPAIGLGQGASATNDAARRKAVAAYGPIKEGMASGHIISTRAKCGCGASRQAGLADAGIARALCRWRGQIDRGTQGDGAPVRGKQSGTIVHQKRDGRSEGPARPERPPIERPIGWVAERKEGLGSKVARHPADHAPRPAIKGIGSTVLPFGPGGDVGPEPRLVGTEQKKGLVFVWQTIRCRQMEGAEHRKAVTLCQRVDFGQYCHLWKASRPGAKWSCGNSSSLCFPGRA